MVKYTIILLICCFPALLLGQETTAAINASRQRLSFETERVNLNSYFASQDMREYYKYCCERWKYAQNFAKQSLSQQDTRYQELNSLLTKTTDPYRILEIRTRMYYIEVAFLDQPEFINIREELSRATQVIADMDKARRLALLTDDNWRQAWERLQSDKIVYIENKAMKRYQPNYYRSNDRPTCNGTRYRSRGPRF